MLLCTVASKRTGWLDVERQDISAKHFYMESKRNRNKYLVGLLLTFTLLTLNINTWIINFQRHNFFVWHELLLQLFIIEVVVKPNFQACYIK